jgi:hypothetical protein
LRSIQRFREREGGGGAGGVAGGDGAGEFIAGMIGQLKVAAQLRCPRYGGTDRIGKASLEPVMSAVDQQLLTLQAVLIDKPDTDDIIGEHTTASQPAPAARRRQAPAHPTSDQLQDARTRPTTSLGLRHFMGREATRAGWRVGRVVVVNFADRARRDHNRDVLHLGDGRAGPAQTRRSRADNDQRAVPRSSAF